MIVVAVVAFLFFSSSSSPSYSSSSSSFSSFFHFFFFFFFRLSLLSLSLSVLLPWSLPPFFLPTSKFHFVSVVLSKRLYGYHFHSVLRVFYSLFIYFYYSLYVPLSLNLSPSLLISSLYAFYFTNQFWVEFFLLLHIFEKKTEFKFRLCQKAIKTTSALSYFTKLFIQSINKICLYLGEYSCIMR